MTQEIIVIGQSVIIILLGAGIKGIFSIKRELSKLNGRIGKIETWQTGHEKLDDQLHQAIDQRFDRLREYMREKN